MTKVIEFFGITGSGKTYLKNKIKTSNSLDYRSNIYKYSQNQLALNYLQKFSLNYFKIIKSDLVKKTKLLVKAKNIKGKKNSNIIKKKNNIFFKKYKNICLMLFKKNKKKNILFANFVLKTIKNLSCKKEVKDLIGFWFKEEFSSYYLFKKYVKDQNIIDSEGFVQRLIIYLYFSKKKNYKKILQKYFNLMPTIDKLFIININSNKINKKYSLPQNIQLQKQIEIFLLIKKFIYNNKKYEKKIRKIVEINNIRILKKYK